MNFVHSRSFIVYRSERLATVAQLVTCLRSVECDRRTGRHYIGEALYA